MGGAALTYYFCGGSGASFEQGRPWVARLRTCHLGWAAGCAIHWARCGHATHRGRNSEHATSGEAQLLSKATLGEPTLTCYLCMGQGAVRARLPMGGAQLRHVGFGGVPVAQSTGPVAGMPPVAGTTPNTLSLERRSAVEQMLPMGGATLTCYLCRGGPPCELMLPMGGRNFDALPLWGRRAIRARSPMRAQL